MTREEFELAARYLIRRIYKYKTKAGAERARKKEQDILPKLVKSLKSERRKWK